VISNVILFFYNLLTHVNHMIGATSTTKKKLTFSNHILTCVNKLCTIIIGLTFFFLNQVNLCFDH
jgi:hypothetical protein